MWNKRVENAAFASELDMSRSFWKQELASTSLVFVTQVGELGK